MTRQDQEKLIELGKSIDIKVTPMEINGELGVNYMKDGHSTNYWAVYRDLMNHQSTITGKP